MPTEPETLPTTSPETPIEPAPAPRGPLTDAELLALNPDVAALVGKLDVIADEAPYLADPRQGVKRLAVALAAYFRAPDAL
jgi:hypothetical protein